MKVVILAGGMGTRISEESHLKPKPMVEIGERPILWHIMKIYSYYGFHDFIICCGYKGDLIKEYFMNYYMHQSDVTIDLANNTTQIHENTSEPWKVTLVNTGLHTATGGRIKMIQKYVNEEPFMMTYGDGVSDVDIKALVEYHNMHGKIATITATRPAGRFGAIQVDEESNEVNSFKEKAKQDQAWVNAGFAVFNKEIFNYLGDGSKMLETEPYEKLAEDGQMVAYKHDGFWSPMDTMRDKSYLESCWNGGNAPWKLWK
ncbi:MAG: glucose-phosphate cytidylyltransferase [Lachnospiraceae bacterium]|jgi:glucose-1-phosphate cytidylyltransferase|nr:glucose-phosphate cytidylyltransferase [Lachnospiraceae bacterium]